MEENNIEQNQIQPNIEKAKKQRNNTGLIVILLLIILLLVGYIVYTKTTEQTQGGTNNLPTTNSDDNNEEITYRKEKKELITYDYEIYVVNETVGKLKDINQTIYIDYYLFNSENEEIININNKILNNINAVIEENKKNGYEIKNVNNQECCYVIKDKDGKMINYQSVKTLEYIINENEEYIVLIENERNEYYAGGGVERKVKNIFTINKKTGKLESYTDYIKSIANISDLKTKLSHEYRTMLNLNNEYNDDEISNKVNQIEKLLNNNEFTVYYFEDDYLYFEFKDTNDELEYPFWTYDEENGWYANY